MDDDRPAAAIQLRKARVRWARLARVFRQEDIHPRVVSIFYKGYRPSGTALRISMLARFDAFHARVAR